MNRRRRAHAARTAQAGIALGACYAFAAAIAATAISVAAVASLCLAAGRLAAGRTRAPTDRR